MEEELHKFPGHQHLYKTVSLHEDSDIKWENLLGEVPNFPRGWYELSRLSAEDRIEFTKEFWLSKLPFESIFQQESFSRFFEELEDIGIYLVQGTKNSPVDAHMVYSLKEEVGFFQGRPPASLESLVYLENQFGQVSLPADYLAFLQIHDGFSKYTDTGLIGVKDLVKTYQKFQALFAREILIRFSNRTVDPEALIPFYESYGLHCYQCFYLDWHPQNQMGNVYFSEHDYAISNFFDERCEDNLAFKSFLSWLIYYLEDL